MPFGLLHEPIAWLLLALVLIWLAVVAAVAGGRDTGECVRAFQDYYQAHPA